MVSAFFRHRFMDKNILIFQNRDILLKVDISDVVYFEADGNFTNIVTRNKSTRSVYVTLGRMDSLLKQAAQRNAENFVRVGRYFIVNIRYIHLIDILKRDIVLSDCVNFTFKLNCSKEALKRFRDFLHEYTREKCFFVECSNNSSAKPTISNNIQ